MIKELPINSYIRIWNWEENENGYGNQIVKNSLEELLLMKYNFNWSDEIFLNCIKSDKYTYDSEYVYCGTNVTYQKLSDGGFKEIEKEYFIEDISNEDIKKLVSQNILDNTLYGELKEIVIEEICANFTMDIDEL